MHMRLLTFTGARDMEGGVTYVREEALPILESQRGFRGVSVTGNRAESLFGIMSLWDTEADRDASDSALSKARKEALEIVRGSITVENLEQVAYEIDKPAVPGNCVSVTRVRMDPAVVEENLALFNSEIGPHIKAQPGFRLYRDLADRSLGRSVLGVTWTDQQAAESAVVSLQDSRALAESRGIEVADPTFREVLFSEMK